ncbi:hypothetical protein J6590_058441 [Homalodisca vitripennis]|nr:hypothetical protein J6590_058441 [Homalodisca vitripennis]
MFVKILVWKCHCNREVAECLTTAESRVVPKFVSPENEHACAGPGGRWTCPPAPSP